MHLMFFTIMDIGITKEWTVLIGDLSILYFSRYSIFILL